VQEKRAVSWLVICLLSVGLALPTMLPEVANIGIFVVSALALLSGFRDVDWRAVLLCPAALFPLIGGLLLTIAFCVTARSWLDAAAALYFAPLFLVAPMAALLAKVDSRKLLDWVAIAATIGGVGALVVAGHDRLIAGLDRAGTSVANPIHFADVSVVIGFVGLLGLRSDRAWVRMASVVGFVAAITAVLLSGSRGPLVAALPMGLCGLVMFATTLSRKQRIALGVVAALVATGLVGVVSQVDLFRRAALLGDLVTFIQTGVTTDASTIERLMLFRTALEAFFSAPIFGHGLANIVSASVGHTPDGYTLPPYQHLHSDLSDFAVAAGALGIVAYGLMVVAPVFEALVGAAPRRFEAVYLAVVLTVGYFVMGVTNAVIGILSQTCLFGFGLALVTALAANKMSTSVGVVGQKASSVSRTLAS